MRSHSFRPRSRERRPEQDALFRARRRTRRLRRELAGRAAVSLLVLVFNEVVGPGADGVADPVIRLAALLGLFLNGPYYLAAGTGRWARLQAYVRMLGDIALITAGLYGAGGLAAAPYLGVYAVPIVYAGIVFSSSACVVGTGIATVSYLLVALLPHGDGSAALQATGWHLAAFNLLILNVVGGFTAALTGGYRQNRLRLGVLYQELERTHDELLRLTTEMQRGSQLSTLGGVLAGVAHELRNVLQVVLSSIELLRLKGGNLPPAAQRYLDQLGDGCHAAMRLVANVLETARQPSAEKVVVSIPEVARRLVELKGYDLRRDGVEIELDFPPDFPFVLAAPFPLQQVLMNLVTNAQDALRGTAGPQMITIAGFVLRERVIVEVRDTGPGIPAAALPRLFEPFYTTKGNGTGLGLSISSGIVRDLGGELTAENAPGGGALFRASFPALPSDPTEAACAGGDPRRREPVGQP
ncbi:MAG: sensor histidine kinase [Candidatus Methylomirabilia bacterium]